LGLAVALPLLAVTYRFTTINPFNSVETSARGINDEGAVVGDFATAADASAEIEHGYLLHDGRFFQVDFPGSFDTDANGISSEGVIVGTYAAKLAFGLRGDDHGYTLDRRGYHALPDPPGTFPDFNAINDDRHIVGVMSTINGNRGFLLKRGAYTTIDCGHSFTEANGINDHDDIVGECFDSSTSPSEHAFLLHEGQFTIFDFPGAAGDGTIATGINDDGSIVGTYSDANGNDHGFIVRDLRRHPRFSTVDKPGATTTTLAGINDDGQLVGTATDSNGVSTGFKARKRDER
jgi:probable HAF family extracellular repeat protein